MESNDFCCYEFNDYRLDPRRRALTKNGEKVPLSARNFDLLLFMVENGGRILEHDELLDKVWAGTFVEQATLKKGISALRQILAEKPENEFIKTIPRRGYSFVSPVRVVPEDREFNFVRETEREIVVEEYEETDEPEHEIHTSGKISGISAVETKALTAAQNKISLFRLAAVSLAGIALIVLTFFAFKPYFSKNSAVPPPLSVENVQVNRVTNTGNVMDAAISPDGKYLLCPTGEKGGISLWLRQMSSNSTSRLLPPVDGNFWGLAFAPDNSYIYYILHTKNEPTSGFYKIPLLGGEPRRLSENVSSIAVSPDGNRIALVRLADKINIFTINTDGEDERPVAVLPENLNLLGFSWTPDGKALLCTVRKIVEGKSLYYISEISAENGGETVVLPPQDRIINTAIWLPDHSAMLVTIREPNADLRQIWQYFPAAQEWRRVTNDNNSYKYVNLTRDGKTIISTQESRLASVWIADNLPIEKRTADKKSLLNNSDNFRQVTEGINNLDWLGWLADNRIMYSITEERKEMLYTINQDGANPRRITGGDDGIWLFPSVTGSGRGIAFLSNRAGLKQVWRVDDDGKNLMQMTRADSFVTDARILRDNSTVLYEVHQAEGTVLFKQTADGQNVQLTSSKTGGFAVSADETMLAVETVDVNTGKLRVELRSLADERLIKTFNFESARVLTFTPDGKNLAYDALYNGFTQIMIQPIDGGEPYPLTDFQTDKIFSFGWSPDGAHLAVIRGKQLNDAVSIKEIAH